LHLYNVDPYYHQLYFEKYLSLNPMFPAATFVDEGIVVADQDIMPPAAHQNALLQGVAQAATIVGRFP
jgi:hypothetical protein